MKQKNMCKRTLSFQEWYNTICTSTSFHCWGEGGQWCMGECSYNYHTRNSLVHFLSCCLLFFFLFYFLFKYAHPPRLLWQLWHHWACSPGNRLRQLQGGINFGGNVVSTVVWGEGEGEGGTQGERKGRGRAGTTSLYRSVRTYSQCQREVRGRDTPFKTSSHKNTWLPHCLLPYPWSPWWYILGWKNWQSTSLWAAPRTQTRWGRGWGGG